MIHIKIPTISELVLFTFRLIAAQFVVAFLLAVPLFILRVVVEATLM